MGGWGGFHLGFIFSFVICFVFTEHHVRMCWTCTDDAVVICPMLFILPICLNILYNENNLSKKVLNERIVLLVPTCGSVCVCECFSTLK